MKYCPYCGVGRITGAASYCAECGEKLPVKQRKKRQAEILEKKEKGSVTKTVSDEASYIDYDEGYDGYYDDLLPVDNGNVPSGINRDLIKNILILVFAVLLVVILCAIMMYYL